MNFRSFSRRVALLVAVLLSACAEQPSKPIVPLNQVEQVTAPVIDSHPTELHERVSSAPGPLLNLGLSALNQGQAQAAEQYFQQVLQRHPEHTVALNALGVLAREAGRFDQAEAYYRQVLAVAPNDLAALRNLGILLELYRGRLAEALALYQRCQSLDSELDAQLKDWIFDLTGRLKKE